MPFLTWGMCAQMSVGETEPLNGERHPAKTSCPAFCHKWHQTLPLTDQMQPRALSRGLPFYKVGSVSGLTTSSCCSDRKKPGREHLFLGQDLPLEGEGHSARTMRPSDDDPSSLKRSTTCPFGLK